MRVAAMSPPQELCERSALPLLEASHKRMPPKSYTADHPAWGQCPGPAVRPVAGPTEGPGAGREETAFGHRGRHGSHDRGDSLAPPWSTPSTRAPPVPVRWKEHIICRSGSAGWQGARVQAHKQPPPWHVTFPILVHPEVRDLRFETHRAEEGCQRSKAATEQGCRRNVSFGRYYALPGGNCI